MLYLFLLLLFLAIVMAIAENYLSRDKIYYYILFGIALIMVASLRPIGVDADSEAYERTFNGKLYVDIEMAVEYSFILIADFIKLFSDDVHVLFFVYATIAITIKLYAISKLSEWLFLPLMVYISGYYLLHDCIQIRVGVASSLVLLAIKPLSDGNKLKALICILGALFFHYSSVVLFPILFFNNKPLSLPWKIALMSIIPIGLAIYFSKINALGAIPIPYLNEKIEGYATLNNKDVFSYSLLLQGFFWIRVFAFLLTLYFHDSILKKCPYLPVILKIMGLSFVYFFIFATLPVVSLRAHELLGIVEIILIPYLFYTIVPSYAGKALVCLISIVAMTYRLFILRPFDF